MRSRFFEGLDEDEDLEASNEVFWNCLLQHVREDGWRSPPEAILDIGCHRGGLLARLARLWPLKQAYGIEPIAAAREKAWARVAQEVPEVQMLDVAEWHRVPTGAIQLITCHEVLYLEPELDRFMARVRRVLAPAGRAYVVLGCHAENPVWPTWKQLLEEMGHATYDHRPMEILAAAGSSGLVPSVRPLRSEGWIDHDPRLTPFTFPDVATMVDHHFKHKLLFKLVRPE